MLILVFLGEIALGIYSFVFSDSLLARFAFFVLTCFLVALLVMKFAGTRIPANEKASSPIPEENIKTEATEKDREVNPA